MKENSDLKKVRILYVVVIGLIFLMAGMFWYFNNKIELVQKHAEANSEMSIAINKRINKLAELNYLDSESYNYLVDPSDWEKTLKDQTGLSIDIPDSWKLDKVIVRKEKDKKKEYEYLDEYFIFLTKSNEVSFNEFVDELFKKIRDSFEGDVLSFDDEKKYYEINSFSEATYNNMYYDYVTYQKDGSYGGPRIKVKVVDGEKQVKIEVNKF